MRNRYVPAPYLSPGFSDFGRLLGCYTEVGMVHVVEGVFMGWLGLIHIQNSDDSEVSI